METTLKALQELGTDKLNIFIKLKCMDTVLSTQQRDDFGQPIPLDHEGVLHHTKELYNFIFIDV